ncbi:hypothetical protein EVAR_85681_1 [Eumeta japonica]|uniref:Uncharacterized protein n=1 Tax=Eumeta variegata TaxID=151549 RepID=A0A4C1W9J3_EUMVA|nr:hypothetical protein EVAR_85681_1 [Eumeta japonica]
MKTQLAECSAKLRPNADQRSRYIGGDHRVNDSVKRKRTRRREAAKTFTFRRRRSIIAFSSDVTPSVYQTHTISVANPSRRSENGPRDEMSVTERGRPTVLTVRPPPADGRRLPYAGADGGRFR